MQFKIFDGFVKSPSGALRFTFVVAAYLVSTPLSSGLAPLAFGAFYKILIVRCRWDEKDFVKVKDGRTLRLSWTFIRRRLSLGLECFSLFILGSIT
jgi:hypothetical protein